MQVGSAQHLAAVRMVAAAGADAATLTKQAHQVFSNAGYVDSFVELAGQQQASDSHEQQSSATQERRVQGLAARSAAKFKPAPSPVTRRSPRKAAQPQWLTDMVA